MKNRFSAVHRKLDSAINSKESNLRYCFALIQLCLYISDIATASKRQAEI